MATVTSLHSDTPKKKYDGYISLSGRDRPWIEKELLPRLKQAKLRIFIDTEKLRPGDDWAIMLEQGILNSRSILILMSESYFSGAYSGKELTRILDLIKKSPDDSPILIPILLEHVNVPEPLSRYLYINFADYRSIGENEQNKLWDKLIKTIRSARYPKRKNTINLNANIGAGTIGLSGDLTAKKNPVSIENKNIKSEQPIGNSQIAEPVNENIQTPKRQEFVNVVGAALSDSYAKNDLLGYSVYVEALANFIESPKTDMPITIGIDAAWGGGKTSLMHMLEKRLGPPKTLKLWQRINDEEIIESSMTILWGNIKAKVKEGWTVLTTPKLWRWPWQKTQQSHFFTIWFNAWKYDQEESLWAALVLEILDQVRSQLSFRRRIILGVKLYGQRFKLEDFLLDILKSVFAVLAIALLGITVLSVVAFVSGDTIQNVSKAYLIGRVKVIVGLGAVSLIPLAYTIIKDVLGAIVSPFSLGISRYFKEPDYKSKVGFWGQFQKDFKSVVEIVTNNGKWPLLIFIDDLDRCATNKAAEVIESINLLLDSEYCVFIIGMDSAMLSRSIQAKYKDIYPFFDDIDYPSHTGLGRHFLEKIIQIDFRIPRPDPSHVSEFITAQLGRKPLEPSSMVVDNIQTLESLIQAEERAGKSPEQARLAVEENHPELYEMFDQAEQVMQERAFEEYPEVEKAIQEMAEFLNYNPRKIKRFINIYRLQALIAYERGFLENLISLDNLARWAVVSMRWPEFINAVVQDSRIVSDVRLHILQITNAATFELKKKEIEFIKETGRYPASLFHLLSDPDFEKLIFSIDGKAGEAQNYLGLNQLFMVQ